MPFRLSILLLVLPFLISACSSVSIPAEMPSDFAVSYYWSEGSLPPPYHNEYDIQILADGQGTIVYRPDYEGSGPEWTESFTVSEEARQAIYDMMSDAEVLTKSWAEDDDPPVGGSYSWMDVTADGETIEVPSFPQDATGLEAIYDAIEDLVPDEIWESLNSQQQDYVDSYEET